MRRRYFSPLSFVYLFLSKNTSSIHSVRNMQAISCAPRCYGYHSNGQTPPQLHDIQVKNVRHTTTSRMELSLNCKHCSRAVCALFVQIQICVCECMEYTSVFNVRMCVYSMYVCSPIYSMLFPSDCCLMLWYL